MDFFKKIWRDSVWSQVIAGIIVAWITAIITKFTQDIFLVLTILSTIVIIGAIIYNWMQNKNNGFTFVYEGNAVNLGMGGSKKGIQIHSFQARMQSKFQKPIKNFNGYVQSEITNESFPIFMYVDGRHIRPEKTNGIPAKALFTIVAMFTGEDPNEANSFLTPGEFLSTIGGYTLHLNADGKDFSFHFPITKVERQIEQFRKKVQPISKPQVTEKK